MTYRAKLFSVPAISRQPRARSVFLGAILAALGLHSFGCLADVRSELSTTSATATSSSSVSTGAGGAGASGGSGGNGASGGNGGMGTGGGPVDGGSGPVEYLGYSLFTHVPRFVIYKVDHTRNLCFRLMLEGFSGPGPLNIDVTDPWAASHAEVTNNVDDCAISMGFPPQAATFANATSGMGTIVVPGGFPCAVDVHATVSFDPIEAWIPASEAFDVDALNIDGGCQ